MENLTLEKSIERWKKIDEELATFLKNEVTGTAEFPITGREGVAVAKEDLLFMFFNHTTYH